MRWLVPFGNILLRGKVHSTLAGITEVRKSIISSSAITHDDIGVGALDKGHHVFAVLAAVRY